MQTLEDLTKASLYLLGNAKFAASTNVTPAASNNFAAYISVPVGVDRAGREITNAVTIGNGTTSFGTFDQSNFASDDLLLNAALTELATRVGASWCGDLFIKPGVELNLGGNVTVPADLRVRFVGANPLGNQLGMNGFTFTLTSTSSSAVYFKDIGVSQSGAAKIVNLVSNFTADNCSFSRIGTGTFPLFGSLNSTTLSEILFNNCIFIGLGQSTLDASSYAFISTSTTATLITLALQVATS